MSKNNTQNTSFFSRHKFKIGGFLLGLILGIIVPQAFAIDGVVWLVSSFVGGSGGALAGGKIDSNYNARKIDVVFPKKPVVSPTHAYQVYADTGILDGSDKKDERTRRFENQFKTAAEQISARRNPANLSASQGTYPHPERPYTPSRRT